MGALPSGPSPGERRISHGPERRALQIVEGDEALARAYLPAFSQDDQNLKRLRSALDASWDAAAEAFAEFTFPRLGALRNYEDEAKKQLVRAVREDIKKEISRMGESWFSRPSAALRQELARLAPAAQGLIRAVEELEQSYAAEKRRKNCLDYSDLEHFARTLLVEDYDEQADAVTPAPFAQELSREYAEIMVDEYQDSNCVQDVLFRALSQGERNLVMVGDLKQSIYRFRLADPTIFLKKYRSFAPWAQARPGEPRVVCLSRNFRSRPEVLEACNRLFSTVMSEGLGDLAYTESEYLYPGAAYPPLDGQDVRAEAAVLDLEDLRAGENGELPPAAREVEARWIAGRIRELVDGGFRVLDRERGGTRPVEYGDIVILMRSLADKAAVYEAALKAAGIPCTSDKAAGLLDTPEVTMVVSLLSAVDNPLMEVPLVSALRSPMFGFTADDLSYIRRVGGSFAHALTVTAREEGQGTPAKCRGFLALLSELRDLAADLPCDKLIWRVYRKTNALGLIGALPDGEARQRNLLRFYQYAQDFERSGYRGLYAFLERLARLAEQGETLAAPAAAGAGAVRIMTIHKSKGLEFPVVILADCNRQFNYSDTTEQVLIHPELGLGLTVRDLERRVEYPSLARLAVAQKLTREMKSEEMRVLYVALTRAREKLILVCTLPSAASRLGSLYARIAGAPSGAPVPRGRPRRRTGDGRLVSAASLRRGGGEAAAAAGGRAGAGAGGAHRLPCAFGGRRPRRAASRAGAGGGPGRRGELGHSAGVCNPFFLCLPVSGGGQRPIEAHSYRPARPDGGERSGCGGNRRAGAGEEIFPPARLCARPGPDPRREGHCRPSRHAAHRLSRLHGSGGDSAGASAAPRVPAADGFGAGGGRAGKALELLRLSHRPAGAYGRRAAAGVPLLGSGAGGGAG